MSEKRLKIIQANNYFYLRGGAERTFHNLVALLSDRGHEAIPFSTARAENWASDYASFFAEPFYPEKLGSFSWHRKISVAGRMLYSFETKRRAERLVDKVRPDLAHCHNIYGALSPSILAAFKSRGVPVVFTVHDPKLLCPNHRMFIKGAVCERCKVTRYYQCAINKCLGDSWASSALGSIELSLHRLIGIYRKNIDLYIACSNFYRSKLIEYGFPPEKIFYVPIYLDAQRYPIGGSNDGYALFMGRLEESKGVGLLVDAALKLKGALKILVVGDGPMRTNLESRAASSNLSNLSFLGWKSEADLLELIRNSMFCVVPSLWYENCPSTVLEAYACGKAVVASRIGGIPEIVDDGGTGFLFEPGDVLDLTAKMERLAGDAGLACEMGMNGRRKVERDFSAERHYESMIALYRRVL